MRLGISGCEEARLRHRSALLPVLVACLIAGVLPQAFAQDDEGPQCEAFYKNPDGSWTATQPVILRGTGLVSRVGGTFQPGALIRGHDIAAELDRACPNPATAAPPPPTPQGPPPRVSLSNFADANGSVDVTRLNCGHLADMSEAEANILLAWYGGAPGGGAARRRLFNMAHLQSAIRNVSAYCRSHREQNLVRVMDDLMK